MLIFLVKLIKLMIDRCIFPLFRFSKLLQPNLTSIPL